MEDLTVYVMDDYNVKFFWWPGISFVCWCYVNDALEVGLWFTTILN